MEANEKIFEVLFAKDDVTWQTILYELVKKEEIDPWNIEISQLTQKYIEMVKQLKEHDFRVSGKVLLAAAILLKIKSNRLVGEDLDELDRIIAGEQDLEFFEEGYEDALKQQNQQDEQQPLIPKMPQPRKRKVSIYDLVSALEKALEVKQRRVIRNIPSLDVEIPKKKVNINLLIQNLYLRIKKFLIVGNNNLTFSKLIPSESKQDKVLTFTSLLHLTNQRKVDINQKEHFGEIEIYLKADKEAEKGLKKGFTQKPTTL
ncbi:MAG: segregation/condensation protein A [Nanoarchaeota archaeon]|nr:segregation/condensation protein A [Nanoarchaeota archaeon]